MRLVGLGGLKQGSVLVEDRVKGCLVLSIHIQIIGDDDHFLVHLGKSQSVSFGGGLCNQVLLQEVLAHLTD